TASARLASPTFLPSMLTMSICMMSGASVMRSGLDFDVDARRQVQLHQGVQRLLRRLEDVEQALVRPDLELLTRLLVDVRRTENRELVDLGGKRDRASHGGPGPLGGVDDLAGRLVQQAVIVGLQANANLGRHVTWPSRRRAGSW